MRKAKGLRRAMGGILTLILGAGISLAEEQSPPAQMQPMEPAQTPEPGEEAALQKVAGKVASIDERKNQLTLSTGIFSSKPFLVEWNTVIQRGDQRLRLGDIKRGDQVAVDYIKQGSQNVARSITLKGEEKTRG